jgi:polysaccharide export outer membrane protein
MKTGMHFVPLISSALYKTLPGEMDLFHNKLPHGRDELAAAQFSNRKITVQGQQVHRELACVGALPGNHVLQGNFKDLMSEISLILRRHTKVFGLGRPIPYLSKGARDLVLRAAILIALFLGIPAFVMAQSEETQNPLLPGAQAQPPEQTSPGSTPIPLKRPVTTPQITNVTPAQEIAEQGQSLKKKPPQTEPEVQPEPDLEFQRFVESSLGVKLPIFGQNLFENVPSTFAPLDRVQVPADYIIGPDDELLIRAWGQVDVNWRAVVDRTGAVYIPQIGTFNVAGVKYQDLHDYLQAQIGRIFKNFQLSVSLGRLRSMQVFVVGQVKKPGSYTISSLSSLVDALFASGGPSKRGSMRRIELKRDGKTVTTFDLYDLITKGDKSKDTKLEAGDVIYVPPVGPLVALAGSINTPAIYELRDKSTLGEAIAYAGGLTNTARGGHAVVERIENRQIRETDEFPLDQEGLARELHDGDVVRFLPISSKFEKTVTLRGNVAVPGHYPWREGMRLHDLIPERNFLVTDEYWTRQNRLALTPQTPEKRIGQAELKNDVKRVAAEINWQYAVIQRIDPQDLSSHLLPFNLGKAIEGDAEQNLVLQPDDVVTIFSQADIQVPIGQQSKFVHVEGEVKQAGVYQVQPGETLRHLIIRIGGLTPQAYLYGSEFTRESTRVDQQQRLDEYVNDLSRSAQRNTAATAYLGDNPDAALVKAEADAQQNLVEKMKGLKSTGRIVLEIKPTAAGTEALPELVLEDGDRLLVPFRPATVGVIGSVYDNGAFVFKPGKTVADYLRLAGGARRDGDKGREFVIRADGSTVSRQQHRGFISLNFDTLRLMPGDTIVVPEKLARGAAARAALRDWATILGQLGLAAGGIGTIFR